MTDTAKTTKKRIHVVAVPNGVRLVRATTKNAAIRYAAHGIIAATVASQDELVKHLSEGVKVEDAHAEDEADTPE